MAHVFRTACMSAGVGIAGEFPLYQHSPEYAAKAARLHRPAPKPFASLRRVGVMWHWRLGRLGGSFYLAARR